MLKNILCFTMFLILVSSTGIGAADDYPAKPITWIVPFGTGGGSDQFARIMEKQIENISETEVLVINIPGSKTAVGMNHFMQKPADGYTVFGATTDSVINLVTEVSNYELGDIIPIAKVQHNVDMWFIKSDEERFTNYDELIEYARINPGELSVATTGLNGADAFSIQAIEKSENIDIKNIPFSEPGERYAALAGGHVDILHEQPGDIMSFLDSGKYKPVIVMSKKRVEGFENIPTTVEKGMDITAGYWRGVWVKDGTPSYAVEYLQDIIKRAVNTKEYKEYEKRKYLHLRKGLLAGETFEEFLKNEYEYYSHVLE